MTGLPWSVVLWFGLFGFVLLLIGSQGVKCAGPNESLLGFGTLKS